MITLWHGVVVLLTTVLTLPSVVVVMAQTSSNERESLTTTTAATTGRWLSTVQSYEAERALATNVTRIQNIDLARTPVIIAEEDGPANSTMMNTDTTTTTKTTPFCHLVMVMPFSGFRPDRIPLKNGVFQGMAALLLAAQHLNTGNGTIVKQVEGLNERCKIRFTTEMLDSGQSQVVAVDHVINAISRTPDAVDEQIPGAFVGVARSAVSIPTSIITGLRGFAQISPISTSTQLDDPTQFRLFGRTIPSDAGTAIPAILYLYQQLGVKHLAVLHVNDAYGNAYALGLQLAAAEYAPDMVIQSYDFPFGATPEIVRNTIQLLKDTNYRYFFGIIFSTVHMEPFMTEAYDQGIAGTGLHNWMFSDSVSTSVFRDAYAKNSKLHLSLRGTTRIGAVGGVPGIEIYDHFLDTMHELNNPQDIDYLQSKYPTYPDEPDYNVPLIKDDPEFFQRASSAVVPFVYDAAIALGLAACDATKDETYFDGQTHFESFKQLEFEGATGMNIYDTQTGTRVALTARFTLLNFVEDPDASDGDIIRFKTLETDVFESGVWREVHPLVFNDGRTVGPPDLPQVALDLNYIGTPLRWLGFAMSGLIITLSLAFSLWTHVYRNARVVRASQPVFLYVITAGTMLMGASIVPLSLDDEAVSTDTCTVLCMVMPWLFCFGWVLSFSALYTKTSRVNIILHQPRFQRVTVTICDVVKPALFLMAIVTVILTLWTSLDQPSWEREITQVDNFGRDVESRGYCSYGGGLPYLVVLGTILLGVLIYAVYEAYRARNLSTEFAESEYIGLVLGVILLVSFLGIPIIVIAEHEPRSRFFASAGVIFIICLAVLVLIFIPKVNAKKAPPRSTTIRVSGYGAGQSMRPSHIDDHMATNQSTFEFAQSEQDRGIQIVQHPGQVQELQNLVDEQRDQIRDQKDQIRTLSRQFEELSRDFRDIANQQKSDPTPVTIPESPEGYE